MSMNWYLICTDCKECFDVAQGYEKPRATMDSQPIMHRHYHHHLMFVSEHYDEGLFEFKEVNERDLTA